MKLFKIIFIAVLIPRVLGANLIDTDSARKIVAPKIEYNLKGGQIKTTGRTEISNASGQKITLIDSYISNKGANASGSDIELWLGQNVHVVAEKIEREDSFTISKNAVFTACYNCDKIGNAWEISTTKMTHDTLEKKMRFHNPIVWMYGIPIFWFPLLDMPDPTVKRKTGILMPNFNSTNNMGTQFNFPLFIALSDTHDATITMSYLTQENSLFSLDHRLNAQHSEYRTRGSYTRNDAGENRWHIFNDDIIELGDNLRGTIYFERASDKTYLQKYGFYNDQPYLDSGARLELFGKSGYVVADAHIFQELRSYQKNASIPSGDILPNIRATHQTTPIFGDAYMVFDADILGVSGGGTANQRMIGDVKIISPWVLPMGNKITAAISARTDVYNFDKTEMANGDDFSGVRSRFLPSGYLEWGLPLLRPGNTWDYIIEPRARLTTMREMDNSVYAQNNDSSGALLSDATLFSDNRFSGLDLWENGTFADYGVRAAAFDKNGNDIEVFLGQTHDFTERADTDPNSGFHNGPSDYVGRMGYDNHKWLSIASRFRFAEENLALRHLETNAQIGKNGNYFTLGHIWAAQFIDLETMADDIHEFTLGAGVRLTTRFSVKWNGIYNMTDEKFQRHTGGLFYDHPCYFLALEYKRDNAARADYVGNTTFQFRFGMAINGVKQ